MDFKFRIILHVIVFIYIYIYFFFFFAYLYYTAHRSVFQEYALYKNRYYYYLLQS